MLNKFQVYGQMGVLTEYLKKEGITPSDIVRHRDRSSALTDNRRRIAKIGCLCIGCRCGHQGSFYPMALVRSCNDAEQHLLS